MIGVELVNPLYALPILVGATLMFLFPLTRGFAEGTARRRYWQLQGITIVGALFGAKLAVLFGDALWPLQSFDDWPALLLSGRSIVGALLFGFLAAEIAKPLMKYHLPPNDRFAVILPVSIALGRIGCVLAGCCRGLPHEGFLTMEYADGIARHPIAYYEMAFHLSSAALLLFLYRQGRLKGRLFALFMILYGLFRFQSEWLRVTEKVFWEHSAYQWFAVALMVAGVISLLARTPLRSMHARETT